MKHLHKFSKLLLTDREVERVAGIVFNRGNLTISEIMSEEPYDAWYYENYKTQWR